MLNNTQLNISDTGYIREYSDAMIQAKRIENDPFLAQAMIRSKSSLYIVDTHPGINSDLIEWLNLADKNQSFLQAVITHISAGFGTDTNVDSNLLLEKYNYKLSDTESFIASIKSGISLIPSDNIRNLARQVVRETATEVADVEAWADILVRDTSHIAD